MAERPMPMGASMSAQGMAVGGELEGSGYRQELKRGLGPFQMFAMSFAFISVVVAIFATYGIVLNTSGPLGIWMWPVVAVGQTLVALVLAQFAARIALTGSSYQWGSRLANPKVGWGFGWLGYCFLGISVVAIDNALASQAFMPLVGIDPDEGTARLITVAILLAQVILSATSNRIVAVINSFAVGLELAIVVVLTIALLVAIVLNGAGSVDNLTSRGVAEGTHGYFSLGAGPFLLAIVMGLASLVGFDAAANMAEEAEDPYRSVPRAMIASVIAAAVLGLVFLIALTIAIPDVTRVTESGSPVAAIMREQLGPVAEKGLLVAITIAFFGAGMVTMATGARLIYAMSRDRRFPVHQVMRRVNPRTQTPIPATLVIFAGGVILMLALPGDALMELITASTILPLLIYAATVVLYLVVRGRLEAKEGAFSLGRLEVPVAVAALLWLTGALCVLMLPSESLTSVLIVGGLIAAGAVFFAGLLLTDREALETEPGVAVGPSEEQAGGR